MEVAADQAELQKALSRAYAALQRRAMTEQELAGRLARFGFAPAVIAGALAKCRDLRLLDDLEYGRRYVTEKSRHARWGGAKIRQGLRSKGIQAEVIQALGEQIADGETLETVLALAQRKLRAWRNLPGVAQKRRMFAFLFQRGFSGQTIEAAMRQIFSEAMEEET
jgi:regulatory protein